MSQWSSPQYPNGSSPMDVTPIQPGNPMPFARNPMDAARSAFYERTPDAQYPDGYLGNVESRRERLYQQGANRRMTDIRTRRAGYTPSDMTRGVHAGSTIGGRNYFWPDEFNTLSGLEAQAAGARFVPAGVVLAVAEPMQSPVADLEKLRAALPSWTSGGPGMGVSNVAYSDMGVAQ